MNIHHWTGRSTVVRLAVLFGVLSAPALAGQAPARIELPGSAMPGAKAGASLVLSPVEVYADDARVHVVDGTATREVPRSAHRFFATRAGSAQGAWLGLAEDGATVEGATFSDQGMQAFSGRLVDGVVEVATTAKVGGPDQAFECGGAPMAPPAAAGTMRRARSADGSLLALPKGGTLLEARVAVDTDFELLNLKFAGSAINANNYIAALFAGMNTMYERDLGVRLVIGDVFLRTSAADPYATTSTDDTTVQLNEFGEYWRVNQSGIDRAFAMQLSGKSGNPGVASGVAWVLANHNYCDSTGTLQNGGTQTAGHFSITRVFRYGGAAAANDVPVIAHELGHNFGARHTHCTDRDPAPGLQPIDQCFNAEASCYTGAVSCPSEFPAHAGKGTVMSYCHFGGATNANCGSVVQEFHPVHEVLLGERVIANAGFACLTPASAGADPDLLFENGFE